MPDRDQAEQHALDELSELCPPPLDPDPVAGWDAAVAALDGGFASDLRSVLDRFGPGAFRASDGADLPFVALVAGDDLTWPGSPDGPLDGNYDVSSLAGDAGSGELRAICFAFLHADQPGTELWWWAAGERSGVALIANYEAQPLATGPAATLLDLVRGSGFFAGFWADRSSAQVTFVPASQSEHFQAAADRAPDLTVRGVYAGMDLGPARRAALRAVERGFRTVAPALGQAIGACLADIDADLGGRLSERLHRLPALIAADLQPPYEPVQEGAHLVEQTMFDLEDHTDSHPLLRGLYEGLHALRAAAILLDFLTLDELPESLPMDLHYRFTFRNGINSEAWLEASPASAVALAEDRAFIAAEMLGIAVDDHRQ